jgi:hypothetical protein
MRITVLLLSLGLASCSVLRPTRVPPPPGPLPARIPSGSATVPPPTKPLPEPPPLEAAIPTTAEKPIPPSVDVPKSAKRPPAPRRRRVAARRPAPPPPPPATVEPAPEAPEPEPTPLLQLGEVLSPQQRTELLRQTDALLAICERAVATATPRLLAPTQADLLNRVRTLSQLSRDARDRSPAEARNLAERAKLFAERLLEDLR